MDEIHKRQDYKLLECESFWVLPLQGKRLCRFIVDHRITLEFLEPDNEETLIVIEGVFELRRGDEIFTMSCEKLTSVSPLFTLHRETVNSALAYKDGNLVIDFGESGRLIVAPDKEFEAWEVAGARRLRIVSMPGGDLAVWQVE